MFGLPATPPTNLVQQLFGAEALVNPGDGNAGRRKAGLPLLRYSTDVTSHTDQNTAKMRLFRRPIKIDASLRNCTNVVKNSG
jgi:hypothetical protein